MGDSRGDKEYLGVDTNVLVPFLDKQHPDHSEAKELLSFPNTATNPTVIHEAYHTLVYAQKWDRKEAMNTLNDYINLDTTLFLNQTKEITKLGLYIGLEYPLGGRDCLIMANFLSNRIEQIVTFDKALLDLEKLTIDGRTLGIIAPRDI
ncbi:putative nucleic acid-binding protein, contains PIN domain [Methanophagales archaeon]|nr:putative nucleic acid-binding protein, contains PIN domain [Methanophagales archaeon]